jgi:ribulose bisphosphate carboxylase small subunit
LVLSQEGFAARSYRHSLGVDHADRQQRTQRHWISMPPFEHVANGDVIVVVTNVRADWGNQTDTVSGGNVVQQRKGLLQ